MSVFRSFAPIVPRAARILILGSMPGTRSVAQSQYYAHPQNAFWPILAHVYPEFFEREGSRQSAKWQPGAHHRLPFDAKLALLEYAGIALWDVLASCQRSGSSDQSIRSGISNPVPGLLTRNPDIRQILLNGRKSFQVFRCEIQPAFNEAKDYTIRVLPSSSPAHASVSFADKLVLWRQALRPNPSEDVL